MMIKHQDCCVWKHHLCLPYLSVFWTSSFYFLCRSEGVDNAERRELDVQAAAASIYSTCNFITSMKNLSCSWFSLNTISCTELPRPSIGNITGVLKSVEGRDEPSGLSVATAPYRKWALTLLRGTIECDSTCLCQHSSRPWRISMWIISMLVMYRSSRPIGY